MRREGIKAKTLGRRYPKSFYPNAPQPLSTKALPAKTLGSEGHFDFFLEDSFIYRIFDLTIENSFT